MTDGGLDYTFECVGNIHTMVFIPLIILLIVFLVWLMLPFIRGPLPDALDVLMSLGVGCVSERREHPGSEGTHAFWSTLTSKNGQLCILNRDTLRKRL